MKNDLYFNEINIGGSLEALIDSYVKEVPLIINEPLTPFELDPVPSSWGLDRFGYQSTEHVTKLQLWERVAFLLSVCGYVLFPNNIQNIRRADKKIIVVTKQNFMFNISYDKVNIFDKSSDNLLSVYDWFSVHSGCSHGFNKIQTKDNFVNQIVFYPSERRAVSKKNKDLVSISYLTEEQIQSVNFTEGMSRLKVIRLMKEQGIRGTRNGYDKTGRPMHYALKVDHAYRDIKLKTTTDNKIEALLNMRPKKYGDLWTTTQKFLLHQKTSI